MGRTENAAIFRETAQLCKTDDQLKAAIREANLRQEMIPGGQPYELTVQPGNISAQIIVSRKRTLEAAESYSRAGKRVCVLNFASASNPGGGVVNGASAQEEAICRCSTLYSSLIQPELWDSFYAPHREQADPLHNDDCIYTPGVVVFRTDTDSPRVMPRESWYNVDVLTCAAPNLRNVPTNRMNYDGDTPAEIDGAGLRALHEKRMRRILSIAAEKENGVLILGAFGCGAFRNPPEIVAEAAKSAVGEYLRYFSTVEFAVYCPPGNDANYRVFEKTFRK